MNNVNRSFAQKKNVKITDLKVYSIKNAHKIYLLQVFKDDIPTYYVVFCIIETQKVLFTILVSVNGSIIRDLEIRRLNVRDNKREGFLPWYIFTTVNHLSWYRRKFYHRHIVFYITDKPSRIKRIY